MITTLRWFAYSLAFLACFTVISSLFIVSHGYVSSHLVHDNLLINLAFQAVTYLLLVGMIVVYFFIFDYVIRIAPDKKLAAKITIGPLVVYCLIINGVRFLNNELDYFHALFDGFTIFFVWIYINQKEKKVTGDIE
jgi:hypothetical protein